MYEEIFREIGLTESETRVYLALLEIGSASTGKIVEKAQIAASKVYVLLDKLSHKGLVSSAIMSGVRYYEATPPERLLDYMKEKEQQLQTQTIALQQILPELKLKRQLSEDIIEANIFRGVRGMESAFRIMIEAMKPTDEWLGSVAYLGEKNIATSALLRIHRYRAEKKLRSRLILNQSSHEVGKTREAVPYTQVKYVPDSYASTTIVNVAGNITLLNIPTKMNTTTFLVESKAVADLFRQQFEKLWTQQYWNFVGVEEVRQLVLQSVSFGDYVVFAEGMKILEALGGDFFRQWQSEKRKHNIQSRGIIGAEYLGMRTVKESITKFQGIKGFATPGTTFVFKDKAFVIYYDPRPIAILIESKEFADSQRAHFEALWKKTEK